MNKYYFDDMANRDRLRDILYEWRNTPYRHACSVKGGGADCIGFVAGVLAETGAAPTVRIPDYPRDWHIHNDKERLLDGIRSAFNVDQIPVCRPANGDIILYRFGKCASHSAIFCDGYIWHCIINAGVHRLKYYDKKWKKRIKAILRIK